MPRAAIAVQKNRLNLVSDQGLYILVVHIE